MKTGILALVVACSFIMGTSRRTLAQQTRRAEIVLPRPRWEGELALENALHARKSIRTYTRDALTLSEVAQLLWAAQGITRPDGRRTAPSAGALYPLELYLVAGHVVGLPQGVYKYRPQNHTLSKVADEDRRADLAEAALGQHWMQAGAVVLVLAAVYERTTRKYGKRGIRYVHMEVGHAAENVYLQAVSSNLGTTFVGAFDDGKVKRLLAMPADEQPLGLMPVGRTK